VLQLCPEAVDCFAFAVSVGALFGLRLDDGSGAALKVHTGRVTREYLDAVQAVQATLSGGAFPCPRPLGMRELATLEEWRDDGEYLDGHDPDVRRAVAALLARLVRTTRDLGPGAGLEPFFSPPGGPLWRVPHNVLFDFEATAAGAEWIDEIARAAKEARDGGAGEVVIGHADWTVKHIRFDGLRPTVVYDWDSLSADYEPVHAGNSAATFTYTEELPVQLWPSADEAGAFLDDYAQARGAPFAAAERRVAGAAAVYGRAYSTRCVHALGGDARAMALEEFAVAFLP
jgi:hypothetical protein